MKNGSRLQAYLAKKRLAEQKAPQTEKVPATKTPTIVKSIDYALVEEQYTYKRIDALSLEQELDAFNLPKEQKEQLQGKLIILTIQIGIYEKVLKIAPDKRWVKGTTIKQQSTEESTIIL